MEPAAAVPAAVAVVPAAAAVVPAAANRRAPMLKAVPPPQPPPPGTAGGGLPSPYSGTLHQNLQHTEINTISHGIVNIRIRFTIQKSINTGKTERVVFHTVSVASKFIKKMYKADNFNFEDKLTQKKIHNILCCPSVFKL
jgi:hypothetical protein